MSYQSGGHTGLATSKLQHRFRGGHGKWRDAHLQPDAHEEGFPADERPEEVCCWQCCWSLRKEWSQYSLHMAILLWHAISLVCEWRGFVRALWFRENVYLHKSHPLFTWLVCRFKISTIHQPNAGKICKLLVELLHSPAKKNNCYSHCFHLKRWKTTHAMYWSS